MKLCTLLNDLLLNAEAKPGVKQTCRLPNGLKVDVKVENDTTYLQVSRSGVYPSNTEWLTIQKYWPYPLQVHPKKLDSHGRRYLSASFPHQARLVMPQPQ